MPYWKQIIILLFITTLSAQAQHIKKRTYTQLYIGVSYGAAFTLNDNLETVGRTVAFQATIAPKNHIVFYRAGIRNTVFDDNSKDYSQPYLGAKPIHKNLSFCFSAGKAYPIGKFFNIQALAGVTASLYKEPTQITYTTTPYKYFDYQEDTKFRPGVIVQAEFVSMPFHRMGITLGTFYHFVPGFSNAGVELSMQLGKIRPRGIGIY